MKSKEIARLNGFDHRYFNTWLQQSGYPFKTGLSGAVTIEESVNIEELVTSFKQHVAEEEERIAEEQDRIETENRVAQQAAAQKQYELGSMLITSGFNFDGYTITKYSGYISGDSAIEINRPSQGWFGGVSGNVGDALMQSLVHIRRNALAELKEAALALGCNAVIGVDFDYLTLDPESATSSGGTLYLPFLFGVTANGNAVIIEKDSR